MIKIRLLNYALIMLTFTGGAVFGCALMDSVNGKTIARINNELKLCESELTRKTYMNDYLNGYSHNANERTIKLYDSITKLHYIIYNLRK